MNTAKSLSWILLCDTEIDDIFPSDLIDYCMHKPCF